LLYSGWESGNQYVYKYVGRSVTGIYKLKMQNAVIELQSRVVVQSIDENNVIVKVHKIKIELLVSFDSPLTSNAFQSVGKWQNQTHR
jgi:hypothetical protein